MGRPKAEDEFGNELKFYTGLGANGAVGFTIFQPDGITPKDLTGLTIKMRIMNNLADTEVVAPITGTITDATAGEIEFNMLAINIATGDIQNNAVVVFINSTTAEEVGEQVRAYIIEVAND